MEGTRLTKQYIGDITKMVVHNTLNKKPTCGIQDIPPEAKREFDALYQATTTGFHKCTECIGSSIW